MPAEGGIVAEQRALRRRLLVAAVLTVGVIVAVAVLAIRARATAGAVGPLPIAAVDQPGAATTSCRSLMAALPTSLAGLSGRSVVDGGPAVAAWGDPASILRCGTATPAELTCSAALTVVDGVAWLQLSDAGQTTYLAADRSVRIALTVPDGTGTGVIQQVSDVVAATLPARPVCRSGLLLPTDE